VVTGLLVSGLSLVEAFKRSDKRLLNRGVVQSVKSSNLEIFVVKDFRKLGEVDFVRLEATATST
jgi:hypothetical protein